MAAGGQRCRHTGVPMYPVEVRGSRGRPVSFREAHGGFKLYYNHPSHRVTGVFSKSGKMFLHTITSSLGFPLFFL